MQVSGWDMYSGKSGIYYKMNIYNAHISEQSEIQTLAEELLLDTAELNPSEFLVCRSGDILTGIGRVRKYPDCYELCTLGVSEAYRGKGIGFSLVWSLIRSFNAPLHVVTDIPHFFSKFGFTRCDNIVDSLKNKQQRCLQELHCELALVMVRNPS
jgi:N-acetylglutamate synthase-like GNAT family acetyltransferase